VEEALENLVKELGNDGVLLCTGSLFIAAAVKDVWKTLKSDVKE
jgi:folylpolyglutamate synthase/dihydropteroate synthase